MVILDDAQGVVRGADHRVVRGHRTRTGERLQGQGIHQGIRFGHGCLRRRPDLSRVARLALQPSNLSGKAPELGPFVPVPTLWQYSPEQRVERRRRKGAVSTAFRDLGSEFKKNWQ